MLTSLGTYPILPPSLCTLEVKLLHFPYYSVQLQDKFWQFATSEWQKPEIEATTTNVNDLAMQAATVYAANLD